MDARECTPPLDPRLAELVNGLDEDALYYFNERAAICEFDGGMSRWDAEALAWEETRRYLEERGSRTIPADRTPKNQK